MDALARFLLARWYAPFLLAALPALLFAVFTQHAWEDWYITYRAAKNLAEGHGLVFEPGQRVHTFTSPFNVLLPAWLAWLTGDDALVLRLYRLIGAALLGGTALWLLRLARREALLPVVTLFLLAFVAFDGKIIDFTINGQEAAFMVFFLAMTVVALQERRALWLGIAWAGLMWSRPDSFIYIGALALGYLAAHALADRRSLPGLLRLCLQAGLLTVVLYGPWIAWTSWYYGTPVPHTVVAKGLGGGPDAGRLLADLLLFPLRSLWQPSALDHVFMPPYFSFGGWPTALAYLSRALAWLAAMAWLCPRVSPLLRSLSFTAFVAVFYLSHVAPPYPWYLPACTFVIILVLALLLQHALQRWASHRLLRPAVRILAAATLGVWVAVTAATAWQLRIQQALIEDGLRKPIGLWLKAQAGGERQTVFLECLGYIGFHSGLKMYDYPGMSSPEMVAARRAVGEDWTRLIRHLQPDWLVLRLREARLVQQVDPAIFGHLYAQAAVFDQSRQLAQVGFLPGRAYLGYDRTFVVFRRVVDTGTQALPQENNGGRTEETPEMAGNPAP